jgi:hypothetical protein
MQACDPSHLRNSFPGPPKHRRTIGEHLTCRRGLTGLLLLASTAAVAAPRSAIVAYLLERRRRWGS